MKYLKIFVVIAVFFSAGLLEWFTSDDYRNLYAGEEYLENLARLEQLPVYSLAEGKDFSSPHPSQARDKDISLGQLRLDMNGDSQLEKMSFSFYSPEEFDYWTRMFAPDGTETRIYGSLWEAFADDLTADGVPEIIVTVLTGQTATTHIFGYSYGALKLIPILDEYGKPNPSVGLGTRLAVQFDDLDGDGIKEIILPIRDFSNSFITPTYYYHWNGEGFMLYDSKEIPYEGPWS